MQDVHYKILDLAVSPDMYRGEVHPRPPHWSDEHLANLLKRGVIEPVLVDAETTLTALLPGSASEGEEEETDPNIVKGAFQAAHRQVDPNEEILDAEHHGGEGAAETEQIVDDEGDEHIPTAAEVAEQLKKQQAGG